MRKYLIKLVTLSSMRKNPQYGWFPNRVELGRPRAASRKSMAIGGGKRKWRNAVGFASILAAEAGVELSVYRAIGGAMHRRGGACAGVNGDRRGGGRGEGFCDVGMVRVFFFLF